jgi:spore germination cell wall hydrolase CwlJ-like protein
MASTTNERECLARAMYFESNRSSDDGMLAVGTVVMNRTESGKYPRSICGVVGQRVQFAPGVLTKQMADSGKPRALRVADQVLAGKRYAGMAKNVYFFHTAGYTYPYSNMHYVAVAGGNAFYEKRSRPGAAPTDAPVMIAQADVLPQPAPEPAPLPVAMPAPARMVVASADPVMPRQSRKYDQGSAAKPIPVAAYQADPGPQADPVIDILPPPRPARLNAAKKQPVVETEVAQNDDADVPDLPPVRPSVGKVHLAPPTIRNSAPQPQFRFEQGPTGISDAASAPTPKPQRAKTVVAQSRSVPTISIRPVAVEADMGGMPAPSPAPKPRPKPQSSLEPEPLY